MMTWLLTVSNELPSPAKFAILLSNINKRNPIMNETFEKVKSGTCKTFAVIGLASIILCVWRMVKLHKASKAIEQECKKAKCETRPSDG